MPVITLPIANIDPATGISKFEPADPLSGLPIKTGNVFRWGARAAAGTQNIWIPAAGKRFRLLKYKMVVSGNANIAAGALVAAQFLDNATFINIQEDFWIPAASANLLAGVSTGWIDLGVGILSAAVNNPLVLNLTAGLVGGEIACSTIGVEE